MSSAQCNGRTQDRQTYLCTLSRAFFVYLRCRPNWSLSCRSPGERSVGARNDSLLRPPIDGPYSVRMRTRLKFCERLRVRTFCLLIDWQWLSRTQTRPESPRQVYLSIDVIYATVSALIKGITKQSSVWLIWVTNIGNGPAVWSSGRFMRWHTLLISANVKALLIPVLFCYQTPL